MKFDATLMTRHDERRFDRGARITLLIVFWLLMWGAAYVLYYFSVPTDGWLTKPPDTFGATGTFTNKTSWGRHPACNRTITC